MRWLVWLGTASMLAVLLSCVASSPAHAGCGAKSDLLQVEADCDAGKGKKTTQAGQKAGKKHSYKFAPLCTGFVNGSCAGTFPCTAADGTAGTYQSVSVDGGPWQKWCVSNSTSPGKGAVTPADAGRALRDLKWPASTLMIEPPDGVTLVNFDTNFFTTNTAPIPQTVKLLEQQVTIEATPSQYHWSFGDGQSMTTTTPGAPYPKLTITHNYLLKGEYAVTLATTYAGRFKVNGGAWQDIPATVTVDGTPQTLRAIEAEPKLVGY